MEKEKIPKEIEDKIIREINSDYSFCDLDFIKVVNNMIIETIQKTWQEAKAENLKKFRNIAFDFFRDEIAWDSFIDALNDKFGSNLLK